MWVWAPHACVHAHAHVYAYMHMYACTHTHTHVENDKHGCLHGGSHLQFPNMFILVFLACACMHIHVHGSRDTLMAPDDPHPCAPSPKPQGAQITKIYKF